LVVNKTGYVDEQLRLPVLIKLIGNGQVTMTMNLSNTVLSNGTLNARVGVKIAGREAIYCPVKRSNNLDL
jgi:hypothetical protein